jgi:hypothetical protein
MLKSMPARPASRVGCLLEALAIAENARPGLAERMRSVWAMGLPEDAGQTFDLIVAVRLHNRSRR